MARGHDKPGTFVLRGVQPMRAKTRPRALSKDPTTPGAGAGSFPNFLYQGGPILANPTVRIVFVGDWSSAANQTRATRLENFVSDLLNSEHMNTLSQYGISTTGTNTGSIFLAAPNASMSHADIVNLLQGAINSATPATHLPEPVPGAEYACMLFLDDNTGVDDESVPGNPSVLCDGASDTAFGYHTFFTTTAGNPFYFGITGGLDDTCITDACGNPPSSTCNLNLTLTREQRQTIVCSHELSEMLTDPQNSGLLSTSNLGWIDITPGEGGELGDMCGQNYSTITVGSNTWSVQEIFSKIDDQESNGSTTCVAPKPGPLASLMPACSIIVERSTFGHDEVNYLLPHAKFADAFYVVVDGFTPDELDLNATNLTSPPNLPSFTGSFNALGDPAIAFDSATGVQLAEPGNWWNIQRITFPYNVTFSSLNAFAGLSAANPFTVKDLGASITNAVTPPGYPTLQATSGSVEFELVYQADPYMSAGPNWWVSEDMRVFTVTPNLLSSPTAVPLAYSSTNWNSDPNTYITNLLTELNTNFTDPSTVNTPFSGISDDEQATALNFEGSDGSGNPVYNFGLARVHLTGDTASNVRVFFRLFISTGPDTDFNSGTTFRSGEETDASGNPIPGTNIALLGFPDSDMSSTIPFFAAPRIDATVYPMTHQSDAPNVQTIPSPTIPTPPAPGTPVNAYFGCWLDLNQGTPRYPVNPSTEAHPDGPYPAADIQSLVQLIMGNHACLVSEINYDSAPIPPGANAQSSDKIGQRNIAWSPSENPGPADAHRIPTLFEVRPTSALVPADMLPDELMIEWGDTPPGSLASIYWPQVDADEVISLAERFYTSHLLTKKDAHMLQVRTGQVTYVPIPAKVGPHLAGLMTLDLPLTVRVGQEFDVVVRRLSWRTRGRLSIAGGPSAGAKDSWRYVVGAFQLRIPVSTGPKLLRPEEQLLAVFKWKLEVTPASNRWHPALQRYVEQLSGRVDGFGGNAGVVQPLLPGQPWGGPGEPGGPPGHGHPHPHPHPGGHGHGHDDDDHDHHEHTGKIEALIYDAFGDFSGFVLEGEDGDRHHYRSHEQDIEEIVREAWEMRTLLSVYTEEDDHDHPVALVLRRWHGPR